jgi:hypothetical protein
VTIESEVDLSIKFRNDGAMGRDGLGKTVSNVTLHVDRRNVIVMNAAFDAALERLVSAYKRHDDLHRSHATIHDLAEARRALDEARMDALRSRNL